MSLELLPNELFLDIFKYLSTADCFGIFSKLNRRLNSIVFSYLQENEYIDLRAKSRYNYVLFWKQYLPPLIDQITSLSLSNDHYTPDQIDQFYAHGFTLSQFIHVQSLSLSHIYPNPTMKKIVNELPHLSTLIRLTFEKCNFNDSSLIKIIWRLPKLVYIRLNMCFDSTTVFRIPAVISSTIKYVHGFSDDSTANIINLLERIPQVRHLSIHMGVFSYTDLSTDIPSITKLNISFTSLKFILLVNFLRRMPNLSYLKVDTVHNYVQGQLWEGLIQKHLTKLKNLQFRMIFKITTMGNSREQQFEQIINTFRNPFWLNKYQWFVQCDWNPLSELCSVYTLPYAFENFSIDLPIYSKSNCAPDNNRSFYERVRRLTYTTSIDNLYKCLKLSHIQFSNIEHITIELPENNDFHYEIKEQYSSTSSSISSAEAYELKCLNKLRHLIEKYSRLTSLHLNKWPLAILNLSQYNIQNTSVSELNLRRPQKFEYYYNLQQCVQLSRSKLGNQCKILTIDVDNWTCIYYLIIKMSSLQVLNVQYRYCPEGLVRSPAERDLVNWLRKHILGIFTAVKSITCRMLMYGNELLIERL